MNKRIAIISRERLNIEKHTSGQEFYLKTLVDSLRRIGIDVKLLTVNDVLRSSGDYDVLHLYYVGLADLIKLRKKFSNSKFVYQVYHVEDSTWSFSRTLSWQAFLIFIQFAMDVYLTTSKSLLKWLENRILLSKYTLIEPYINCSNGFFNNLEYITKEKFQDLRELILLYIGRMNPYRFPLKEVIESLKPLSERIPIKLIIVSKLSEKDNINVFKPYEGLEVTIIDKWLSDDEKREIFRKAHFFLFPAKGNTAMNPPITVLESVCYGTLPLVSPIVMKDLDIPKELIIDRTNKISEKIIQLVENPTLLSSITNSVKNSFRKFYDESRFISALREVI
jgi:glycosyltransferase involved in cell wall biosynthesis